MKALAVALVVAAAAPPAPIPNAQVAPATEPAPRAKRPLRSLDVVVEVDVAQLADGVPVDDPRARFRQARRAQVRFDAVAGAVRATFLVLADEDTFDGEPKVHPSIGAGKQYVLSVDGDAVKIRRAQPGGFGYVDDGTGLGKTPAGSEDDDVRRALLGLPAPTPFARALATTTGDAVRLDAAQARRAFPVEHDGMFRVTGAVLRRAPDVVDEGGRRLVKVAATVDVVVTDPAWTGAPFTLTGDVYVDADEHELARYAVTGRFTVLDRDAQALGGTLSAHATLGR